MRYLLFLIFLCSGVYSYGQHPGGNAASVRLAYVNMDTLEAKYELLIVTRAKFIERRDEMETELKTTYDQMQHEAENAESNFKGDKISQADYNQVQKRLAKMQQDLETRKQELTEQLTTEQQTINNDMRARLDEFLQEFNKTHHYDCILSYSWSGSSVLFVDKRLDITTQVVNGMNALAKKEIQENK